MKARIALALLMLALFAQPNAQTAPQTRSPLQQMVQTEQAFSRMAAEQNTRAAFLAFIADDGLLFRPTAVNGKQWLRDHPAPPSDKHPLLAWQPAFAGMAAAGDLGFTTGPWEFKQDVKAEKAAAYGHFVTLWKKQPDGTWKFVVDLGISHPMSGGPQTLWQPPEWKPPARIQSVDVAGARQKLLDFDRSYSQDSTKDLVKAFTSHASADVRLYRDGSLPFIGRTAAANALGSAKGQVTWTTAGGDVSRSGDLGYTYGTYELTDATKVTERGSYVRIWQNERGQWRIVLDVANPQQ
jgi:ketosteroid isomerase-like protein